MPTPPAHIVCVVAARPNLMKMAPILRALARFAPDIRTTLVHTGQHYDQAMDAQHFAALEMAAPDIRLEVGSGSHAQQTANVMLRFEQALAGAQASAVLVVGDVNSTLACALVAAKEGVPVIHVEAGLRSGDRAMPEEINRILTDQLSTLLLISEPAGRKNLLAEGIADQRIHFVGNVMIDSLTQQLARAVPAQQLLRETGYDQFLQGRTDYGLLTLHRPANVDDAATFRGLLTALSTISHDLPLIFPVHPRTRARLDRLGLQQSDLPAILLLPPQDYLHMLGLMRDAKLVLSDSGGVQEETTALGVPCITLRENTERPITVSEGSNTLAGTDPDTIISLARRAIRGPGKQGKVPQRWDGHAGDRIAAVIAHWLAAGAQP